MDVSQLPGNVLVIALLIRMLDTHLLRGGAALLATHHDMQLAGGGLNELRLGS